MKRFYLFLIATILASHVYAQHKCSVSLSAEQYKTLYPDVYHQLYKPANPTRGVAIYTIPVVVHVIYNAPVHNLHDSIIHRQIEELNRYFSGNALVAHHIPFEFQSVAAGDTKIRFELAKRDPNGFPTNGITRKQTWVSTFNISGHDEKHVNNGGTDAWDTERYLNIWVCNYSANGSATLPGTGTAEHQGIVIRSSDFGTPNLTYSPNLLPGVCSAAHEAGHYLGLNHIWGAAEANTSGCGDDDGIADSPTQDVAASAIPTATLPNGTTYFPLADACQTVAPPGIMFMNLMDYNNDPTCMMFTMGQRTVMRNALEGPRASLVDPNNLALTASEFNANSNYKVWNTGFPSNSFRSIASGKNGEMWAGTTGNGIFRYNETTDTWDQVPTTTNHIVRNIKSDNEGNVAVASSELVNSSGGGIMIFENAGSFNHVEINSLADPANGIVSTPFFIQG